MAVESANLETGTAVDGETESLMTNSGANSSYTIKDMLDER
jgi:hypothetical protein